MDLFDFREEQNRLIERVVTEFGTSPSQMVSALLAVVGGSRWEQEIREGLHPDADLINRIRQSILEGHHADMGLSIRETVGVMGGVACVRSTRIPVWLLVSFKKQGMSDGDLLRAYPSLDAADLLACWDYYTTHSDLIEAQIREQDEEETLVG